MFNFAPFVKLVELSKKETLTPAEAQEAKDTVNQVLPPLLPEEKVEEVLAKIDERTE